MADLYSVARGLVHNHGRELDILLQQGVFKPVFLYHVVIFHSLPMIGLVLAHRGARYVIFALCLGFAFEIFKNHRALIGGNGYMLGLIIAWWLVWTATLLVFTDVEHDFQRIERAASGDIEPPNGTSPTSLTNGIDEELDQAKLDGQAKSDGNQSSTTSISDGQQKPETQDTTARYTNEHETFHWQSYPHKLSRRLDWCAGLLFNLRGPEWNWRAPHMGPIPRSVNAQLQPGSVLENLQVADDASLVPAKKHLRGAFVLFITSYFILDGLKFLMMHDPYFLATGGPDSVPPFPFSYLASSSLLLRFYHCFFSCMGVYVALVFVTALNPIIFLGLSLAFPNAARKLTSAPLDASWLYSDTFGPFIEPVLDNGLAGCWGRWWHQLFRYGFVATARWILCLLPSSLGKDSRVKRITYVVVAFALSGIVHASGSFTQFIPTRPLSGPLLFFLSQGVAIVVENIFKTVLFPLLPLAATPRWLRRTANAVFVFCWLLYSGAFIADDFARGGLWLMEPLPFSPLRGLGLVQGEGFWCWREPWFQYWTDGTYWGSGIRVI